MRVPIEIERSIEVAAPAERLKALFDDVEGTIRRFPKLKKLTRLDEDLAYRWDLQTMGSRVAGVSLDLAYAARYRVDAARGELSWEPVPGHGNATIHGRFRVDRAGEQSRLSFRVWGELHDVPVPTMYRLLAAPFIQGKFTQLVDTFLERTGESLRAPGRRR